MSGKVFHCGSCRREYTSKAKWKEHLQSSSHARILVAVEQREEEIRELLETHRMSFASYQQDALRALQEKEFQILELKRRVAELEGGSPKAPLEEELEEEPSVVEEKLPVAPPPSPRPPPRVPHATKIHALDIKEMHPVEAPDLTGLELSLEEFEELESFGKWLFLQSWFSRSRVRNHSIRIISEVPLFIRVKTFKGVMVCREEEFQEFFQFINSILCKKGAGFLEEKLLPGNIGNEKLERTLRSYRLGCYPIESTYELKLLISQEFHGSFIPPQLLPPQFKD